MTQADKICRFFSTNDIADIFEHNKFCHNAMKLFFTSGHTFSLDPKIPEKSIREMVYSDINHNHVFSPSEWVILDDVENISFLFTNDSEYFGKRVLNSIDYFCISLNTSENEIKQSVYDIHRIISWISPSKYSIILFKFDSKYLFSFATRRVTQNSVIALSDWYSVQDMINESLLNSLDASNYSNKSVYEFYLDFIYYVARRCYTHPLSYDFVAYELLNTSLLCCKPEIIDGGFFLKAIEESAMNFLLEYQDEFLLENKQKYTNPVYSTDDFSFESFELENSINEEYLLDSDNDDIDVQYELEDEYMSDELLNELNDPISLLKYLEDQSDVK